MKKLTAVVSSLSWLFLTSCGGGGGSGPASAGNPAIAAAVDKYVGTWVNCFPLGFASERETLVISKQDNVTGAFTATTTGFADANCAGQAGASSTEVGTLSFSGAKTIGSDTVEKLIVTIGGVAQKQVIGLSSGGTLVLGLSASEGGTVDADGFPNRLASAAFTQTNSVGGAPPPAPSPAAAAPSPSGGSPSPAPVPPPAAAAPPAVLPAPVVCRGNFSLTVDISAYGCSNENWTFNGSVTVVGVDFERTGAFTGDVTVTNITDTFQGAPNACSPTNLRSPPATIFNGAMNLSRIGGGTVNLLDETVSLQFSVGSLNTVLGTIAGSGMTGRFSCTY